MDMRAMAEHLIKSLHEAEQGLERQQAVNNFEACGKEGCSKSISAAVHAAEISGTKRMIAMLQKTLDVFWEHS
jgi:hypothetical protein